MDQESIKTIFSLLQNPDVIRIMQTTTVSQLRLVGITASSRKDPARNMRLASNLSRPFPIMVKKTPEILEIIKREPRLFHKDDEHDQHNIVPTSLLLPDKIAFGDLKLASQPFDYTNLVDHRAIEKCRYLFGEVSLHKETRPMESMIVRKDTPVIETKVPVNSLLKALICPDYSIISTEEAHALSMLKPWFPMFNHLSIEAISHKIKCLIDPPMKHIRANQRLPTGCLTYQPLVQFENIKVTIPGLIISRDDESLIRACRYLLQATMRETENRNMRVEKLRGTIKNSQLSGTRLEGLLKTSLNKNIYIQVCQMAIGVPMQNEIHTNKFCMKIIVSDTQLSTVSYMNAVGKRMTFEKYTGEEEIVFKYKPNQRINGIFFRNRVLPHRLVLSRDIRQVTDVQRIDFFTDLIMAFKTHDIILERIPMVPIKNLHDLRDRIAHDELSHEMKKFKLERKTNLNYDYRKSLYIPELMDDLSVVNKGAKLGSRLSIYSVASLVEDFDPRPIDLTSSEIRLSAYEILSQSWEALFYDTYTYDITVRDIGMLVSTIPSKEKVYSTLFKLHQRRVRNSFACNMQAEAVEWLRESINNPSEKRISYLLWLIVSSTMTVDGSEQLSSVNFGKYVIQPHVPNSNFYESETYYMMLGNRYSKVAHNKESLKRKYDLTPTHQIKRSKILTISNLINSDLHEGIVQVGNDVFHAKKRKYEDTIDKWVSESIESRVYKRPRIEDIETDSEDDEPVAGPSGEVLDIMADEDDRWFDEGF